MIYEMRTYDIRPRGVPEYQKRFEAKLSGRLEFSKLFGHWYTEVGPLNQIVAIWPYDSLEHRAETRAAAEASGKWPPDTSELILSMRSEIYMPAPFMSPTGERDVGPIYEMRLYTYQPEVVPTVLEVWGDAIAERQRFSPLVGCWYSEGGGLDNFVHLWAYRSFDERLRIRLEAREKGVWPTPQMFAPDRQRSKVLLPASFSPLR